MLRLNAAVLAAVRQTLLVPSLPLVERLTKAFTASPQVCNSFLYKGQDLVQTLLRHYTSAKPPAGQQAFSQYTAIRHHAYINSSSGAFASWPLSGVSGTPEQFYEIDWSAALRYDYRSVL